MTSRECVLRTVRREEPDRVPFNMRFTDAVVQRFRAETGAADNDFETCFQHDLRRVGLRLPLRPKELPRLEWFPEPAADAIAECAAKVEQLHAQNLAVFSAYICGVFEEAKEWVGDEALLTLPFEDPDRLEAMLDRITRLKMKLYGA